MVEKPPAQSVDGASEEEVEVEKEEVEVEEQKAAEESGVEQKNSSSIGGEINVSSLDELRLDYAIITNAQEAWQTFINASASREAAGEAIYAALFDSAPSLQSLFTTPRAVQAMRFMNGLNQFVMGLSDPPALKILVETLGFGHLNLDVTVPRVVIFRDAILDLLQVELGAKLTSSGYQGWRSLLNYVGGAIIFVKAHYADRLRILEESWKLCNSAEDEKGTAEAAAAEEDGGLERQTSGGSNRKNTKDGAKGTHEEKDHESKTKSLAQNVPTTYREMFQFNAAVMGFGQSLWMTEVLECFKNIVVNVANSNRLEEECCVLVLRISKVTTGKVNLAEYKSCMLATLRSLLPKAWSTAHEVAWSWLWENVERMLKRTLGSPPMWETKLNALLESIDEATGFQLRKDIYLKFFSAAPAGQDFFKQSNTYLHLIATKVLVMSIDMYKQPIRMVDDISALGLRHVGYAIPTDLIGAFVTACVEVVQGLAKDEQTVDAFRWSLGLIAKSLTRTILEGSTIVMKAINVNTKKSLNKAVSCAPRGLRNQWMLKIEVGTQNISPLAWAIESGALDAASAMIHDLLTIRADRDKYYYGAEDLFTRHGNIVKILAHDAPALLPELLTGLIWRSRIVHNGYRRVNYYCRHLLIDHKGRFGRTLKWVEATKDPIIVCHPALVFLSDISWKQLASKSFLFRKTWLLFTLVIFVTSQSILMHITDGEKTAAQRQITFLLRAFIYVFSCGQMLFSHSNKIFRAFRSGDLVEIAGKRCLPRYLQYWQESANLFLLFCLLAMLSLEPILHCLGNDDGKLFTQDCDAGKKFWWIYSVFSMVAMVFYYTLLIDMAIFNTRVSAFVLLCGRMLIEVALCFCALFSTAVMFASAVSCLEQKIVRYQGLGVGIVSHSEMVLGMYGMSHFEELADEPIVLFCCIVFIFITVVFLLNMLIAQLTCAYDAIYTDMVGYAHLKRMRIIVDTMPQVPQKRWEQFKESMNFEEKIEFNEGDIGLSGGMQVMELASIHPTTEDRIKRFGGSTAVSNPWPEEDLNDDTDKFEHLEKAIQKAMARLTHGGTGGSKRGKNSSSSGQNASGEQGDKGEGRSGASGASGESDNGIIDEQSEASVNEEEVVEFERQRTPAEDADLPARFQTADVLAEGRTAETIGRHKQSTKDTTHERESQRKRVVAKDSAPSPGGDVSPRISSAPVRAEEPHDKTKSAFAKQTPKGKPATEDQT